MRDRRLLENGVPVALLNKEAQKEKLAVSPHVLLHYYFTRKPLITARLAIAGGLLSSKSDLTKEDFFKLMGLHHSLKKRAYLQVSNKLKETIKKQYPDGLTVFDPFAGSGTISLEALRMGLDTVALDYNPVSYLIMKATLEFPIAFGNLMKSGKSKLYHDVEHYAHSVSRKVEQELGSFFPDHNGTKVKCYVHAWAVKCPYCGRVTPLVTHWELDSQRKIGIKPIIKEGKMEFEMVEGEPLSSGNVEKGKWSCAYTDCALPISGKHIVDDIYTNEREILLAVYLENGEFQLPTEEDKIAIERAASYLKRNLKYISPYIPSEPIPPRDVRSAKYLKYWYKLFSARQLLVHSLMVREIREVIDSLKKDNFGYATAIGTYLTMILSKHLMANCRSAYMVKGRKSVGPVVANRGISMMWNHIEINPFVKTAGSIVNGIQNILSGLDSLLRDLGSIQQSLDAEKKDMSVRLVNASILSWQSDRKFSIIVTDPPYYDDVQYPELMQFFQVWHSKTVGDLFDIPPTPSTVEELSVGYRRDERTFESRMLLAIKRLHDLLEDDGVLVLFYAHKSIDGWKYVLESLRKAGFIVTSTHTLRTESGAGTISKGRSSVFHSLLLTARKRLKEKSISVTALEKEVKRKMEARYNNLVDLYGNDRLNLMVAASGVVIETITSYSEIESFTKDTADYALEIGQQYLIELFAKRSLDIDLVDPKTMLYVWLRYSAQKSIPFSEFNQTLKVVGVDEDIMSDVIQKKKNRVRILDFSERGSLEINGSDPLLTRSVIDSVHLVLRGYMRGGVSEVIPLIRDSPYGEDVLIHTIKGLAKLASLRSGYEEGETCIKFLRDWGLIVDGGKERQAMKLDFYLANGEDDEK